MIIDCKKTQDFIVSWIKTYSENAGIKTLVVGLSGGIDSALTALLCQKTGLPTICVALPCRSSHFSLERATAFTKEQKLKLYTVDLTEAYESVINQTRDLPYQGLIDKMAVGGFRSCLRAPTLSYFALATRGLVVGTGNRSEDNLIRYFQKFGDGCVDISPIADLFKSEVYELFSYMTNITYETRFDIKTPEGDAVDVYKGPNASLAIFMATPTADLWGEDSNQTDEEELGITYDEVEWADRQNELTGKTGKPIIMSDEDPSRHPAWLGYTGQQRKVIAKIHQMEKMSRHKFNPNLPICPVRSQIGLVK